MISRFLLFLSVVFLGIGQIWGQTTTFFSFTGTSGYLATPANGWSSSGTEGGSYLKLSPGSVTSPEYSPANNIVFKYDIGSFGSGTGSNTKLFILDPLDNVLSGFTLTSTTGGSTYTTNQTINVGNVTSNFKVKIEGFGTGQNNNSERGTRLRNYSLVGEAITTSCEQSNLTFANPTVTADLVDGTFTQTASSLNETTAITYESSDEAVATVNPSTGEVSLLGLGTTTITANQEAGTHGGIEYCAGTATYELTVISTEPAAPLNHLVISQVYGAGGNNGATYNRDYVELFNPTNSTISLTGYSLQYASATNTFNNIAYLSGSVAPGKYFLIGLASGSNGIALPTPDLTPTYPNNLNLGAANGKIVLANNTTQVTSPTDSNVVDYVGFGTATAYEGSGAAPAPSTTNAIFRSSNGCDDTDDNAADFSAAVAAPRNSATAANICVPSTDPYFSVNPSAVTDLNYVFGSGPSDSQSFVLSGENLDGSEDVMLLADTGFEISLNDVDYFEEETLSAYDGTATDIYVRLKSGLPVDTYSGIILIGGYGTDAEVSLSGEVTAPIGSYFRSQADGNWTSTATWESSEDGGLSWADATTYPGASAESVVILADHTVNLNSPAITITNTEVFGAIQVLNSNYSVDGDEEVELFIKNGGEFIVNGSGYASSGTSFGLIETGGKVIARNIPEVSGAGSDFVERYLEAFEGLFYFADGGICEWDCTTTTLGTQGFSTIFAPFDTGDIAILRFTSAPPSDYTMGSGANTVFNAFLELTNGIEINISGSGQKTFVGGIRGEGIVDVYSSSGNINLGTTSVIPEMGGNILLRIPTAKLKLPNGANVTTDANFVIERSDNTAENGSIDRQGGILNINGTLDITNMRITNTAPGGVFVKDGGTLRTRHTGGLFGDSSAIVNATNFTMETGSTIDYYATEDQTISTGKEYYHLILSGGGIKTPQSQSPINFYTIDSIQYGSITITENPIVDFSGNNLGPTALNHVNFNMDGGRLILGTGGTQPNMRGAYNLSGGVIEFANSSASGQTIRSTNAYSYQNIEVTGNSVGTSGGNLVLNENGTFVVKPNGIFKINTNSIVGPEGNQTIEIEGNGTFRTGNADGFSGGDGTSNPGQTTSIRNNIENIILHPNSIVEYSSSSDQTITNGIVTTPSDAHYENLIISGTGAKTLPPNPNSFVKVNNNFTVNSGEFTIETGKALSVKNIVTNNANANNFIIENDASLVQINSVDNIGNITAHRHTQAMVKFDATYWSSPVAGQKVKAFSQGTLDNRFYIYNGYNESDTNNLNGHFKAIFVTDTNYPMPTSIPSTWYDRPEEVSGNLFVKAEYTFKPGWGYSIRVPNNWGFPMGGSGGVYERQFIGVPHNGDIEVPAYGKYTMVGNPYPSAIEIEKFFDENSNVATLHFWTHVYDVNNTNYNSNYSTVTDFGGAGNTVVDSHEMNDNIEVGQGFVVEHAQSTMPETNTEVWPVYFKNDMRVKERGVFQKQNNSNIEKHRFWLNVYDITTDLSIAQVLLGYMTGATNDYDHQLDGRRIGSAPLYSIIDEEKYTVQARALPFSDEDIIPLGISPIVFGKYKIEIDRVDGLFAEGQEIYLKDNYLQTLHNLSLDGGYEFEAEVGEFHNRFEIVFKPEEVMETIESELNNLLVYHSGDNLVIESKNERILSVELYDLSGKSVHRNEKVNAHIYKISKMSLATQVLIVKVLTEDGQILSKKIINQ